MRSTMRCSTSRLCSRLIKWSIQGHARRPQASSNRRSLRAASAEVHGHRSDESRRYSARTDAGAEVVAALPKKLRESLEALAEEEDRAQKGADDQDLPAIDFDMQDAEHLSSRKCITNEPQHGERD